MSIYRYNLFGKSLHSHFSKQRRRTEQARIAEQQQIADTVVERLTNHIQKNRIFDINSLKTIDKDITGIDIGTEKDNDGSIQITVRVETVRNVSAHFGIIFVLRIDLKQFREELTIHEGKYAKVHKWEKQFLGQCINFMEDLMYNHRFCG